MYEQFRARAEAVSAEVHRFAGSNEALAFLVDLLAKEEVAEQPGCYGVLADCPFLQGIDRKVLDQIEGVSFEVSRERAAGAKIGISQVDWALADTGTLVQDATAIDKRLVSTLPTIHVALIATAGLRPDMPTVLEEVDPQSANFIAMITGPSRTADIERVLTIGVHGPERLIIVFIDQLAGGELMQQEFKQSIDRALHNANLTGALGKFSEAYKVNRAKAYEGIDFEALRTSIADLKGFAASHIDELCDLFQKNAEAKGTRVFRTKDPAQVREYILKVAKENGVKSIVKSKSMATEEIHLNPYLEKAGIEVNETDLGEWIIQLAGQTPSHMVMPAIHMTKEEVADIFSKEVDERLSSDIPRLVKVARNEMRPKFLRADMGISGGNIAVAETGSIALVTNEGNARMVTTLPKIHIAVVGVEKLVAKFREIAPILKALPRSATAQLLTSYVTIISGPTPTTDGTMKELHVILMDNHRTDMAADPMFKEALQCIRCASCLNVCPIFRLVGGHVFGKVYTGGIGTILTAWHDELKSSEDIQGLCIQCGACKDVCPGKIDIPGLIMEIRRRLVKEKGMGLVQKSIFTVVNNRRLFHSMLRAASVAAKPFAKGTKFIRHLPMFLADLTDGRSLPAIAPKPFRDVFQTINQPRGLQEKAVFYAGCLIDFAYPEMGESLVKILNKAGVEVLFPEGQTCCGAPARYNGAYETAAGNAVDNIQALLAEQADYVVSACPTCTVALDHEFIATFESLGRRKWLPQARELAGKTIDFSTLVKKLVDEGRLTLKEGQQLGQITYHDSCHLKRTLKADQPPRVLLEKVGYELNEMFECDICCGMGGSYSLKLPEISAPILQRKLKNIKDTGAPVVAMDCPGCVMQIRGGMDQDGAPVQVRHTVELIADQLKD